MLIRMTPNAGTEAWTPVFATLLPEGVTYKPDSLKHQYGPLADATPEVQVIDDYQGTGRQLVRVTFNDDEQLVPPVPNPWFSGWVFDVNIGDRVPVGKQDIVVNFFEKTRANTWEQSVTYCVDQGYTSRDSDEDTNYSGLDRGTDYPCPWTASFTVMPPFNAMLVEQVKGSLDADYSVPTTDDRDNPFNPVGLTTPGGENVYNISITNDKNTPLKDIVFYNLLPAIGDTGTGPLADTQRGSQWAPEFVRVDNLPEGATLEYSTAQNPCRAEVTENADSAAGSPDGCVDDWSTNLPSNPASVTALRVKLGNTVLQPQQMVSFRIVTKTPANETSTGIAWNTSAVSVVNAETDQRLPAFEPNKVGLRISDLALNIAAKQSVECYPADAETTPVAFTVTVKNLSPAVRNLRVNQLLPAGTTINGLKLRVGDSVLEGAEEVEFADENTQVSGIQTTYDSDSNEWSITNLGQDNQITLLIDAEVNLAEFKASGSETYSSAITWLNNRSIDKEAQVTDVKALTLTPCPEPTPSTTEETTPETTSETTTEVTTPVGTTSEPAPSTEPSTSETSTTETTEVTSTSETTSESVPSTEPSSSEATSTESEAPVPPATSTSREPATPIIPIPVPVPDPKTPGSSDPQNPAVSTPATPGPRTDASGEQPAAKRGPLANTGADLTLILILAGLSLVAGFMVTRKRREN